MNITSEKRYFIRNYASGTGAAGQYLNIWGTSFTGNMQKVKTYTKVKTDPMQKWFFTENPETGCFLRTECNGSYTINMNTTSNPICTMYTASGNEHDGLVKLIPVDDSQKIYYIYLVHRGLYLTAESTNSGAVCSWKLKESGSNLQKWQFEEIETPNTIYTGILARNTGASTTTGAFPYIISNIPDKLSPPAYIENNVEFHPGCGFSNGTNFNTSPDGAKVKNQLQKFIKKVFGSSCNLTDQQTCFYLFGERYANGGSNNFHSGVDINYYEGAPIRALFGGVVTYVGGVYGTVSVYNSQLEVTFNYVHMSNPQVSIGSQIAAGALLGYEGRASSPNFPIDPHLHFEVVAGKVSGPQAQPKQPSTPLNTILPYGYMDGIMQ